MGVPKTTIIFSNGNLGRLPVADDGVAGLLVSGVAVGGQFALGDIIGPFYSIEDVEAKGITAAYDVTNECLAWNQANLFFEEAGNGLELYMMVLAKTVTMAQMCATANNYAAKLLRDKPTIKLVGITRVPDSGFTPTLSEQFETDLWTAISNLVELRAENETQFRYPSFFLEGRNFQGTVNTARDLRHISTGPLANRCHVVIGSWDEIKTLGFADAAAVGTALGRAAAVKVNRNIGRVKDGPLKRKIACLSDGSTIASLTDTERDTLNDRGYIFFRTHVGKAGVFFNDDHAACPITDDYAYLNRGRTMDKAARITRSVYLEELLDEVELDEETGRMNGASLKNYQSIVEQAINAQMTGNKEITRVKCTVDPLQNILSTDKIETKINIIPTGTAREIESTLAYENPSATE